MGRILFKNGPIITSKMVRVYLVRVYLARVYWYSLVRSPTVLLNS